MRLIVNSEIEETLKFISFSKAKEIHDRMTLKSAGIAAGLNDCAKTILCLDIACELFNIVFDTASGVQYSSLRKSNYERNRKMMIKLMNLNKKLDIKDVMLKIGLSNANVEKSAKRIFKSYEQSAADADLDHPQYVTMSVHQACKLEKVKIPKKNLIPLSNLKNNQWSLLEKSWDKFVASMETKENEASQKPVQQQSTGAEPVLKRKLEAEPEVEDYAVWAKRTLAAAYAELDAMNSRSDKV